MRFLPQAVRRDKKIHDKLKKNKESKLIFLIYYSE